MKRLLGAILALVALTGTAAATSELTQWRYLAPVQTAGQTGYVNIAVPPDSPLWEKGRSDLTDLRVVDDQGQTVPYLLWHPQPAAAVASLPGTVINAGRDEARALSTATLDLGERPPTISQIQVALGLEGRYLLAAQVEGSQDQKEWLQLPTSDLLYHLTAQGGERNDVVRFAGPVQMRYIRVLVPDFEGRPAPVRTMTVSTVERQAPPQEPAFAGKPTVTRDAAQKASVLTLDMTSQRRADELELITTSPSFFRQVTVEGSSDNQSWQRLARAMVYRYEADGQRRVRTTLPLSGCQCRYLRLVVEDGDDAPLADPEIRVTGVPHRIFFEAQSGRSYSVYVGNPEAGRPEYDLARIPVNTAQGAAVSLGPVTENPAYEAKQPPASDRFPWLLPAVLILLVLVVGAGGVQMAKRVRAREAEQAGSDRTDRE